MGVLEVIDFLVASIGTTPKYPLESIGSVRAVSYRLRFYVAGSHGESSRFRPQTGDD